MWWMSSPIHTNQKIEKTLNPIVFPSKFEGTLHTLDLDIAQFPSVTENTFKWETHTFEKMVKTLGLHNIIIGDWII